MLLDNFYVIEGNTSNLLLRMGVILDQRQSLLSHILLGLGEADRELGANLYVTDAFVLQSYEREGCRSSCVVAEAQLTLLV